MQFKDSSARKQWRRRIIESKGDPYILGIIEFSKRFAELLEAIIENTTLDEEQVVSRYGEKLSDIADVDGMTVNQYVHAIALLNETWRYGSALIPWHNGRFGFDGGGIVNPAVVVFQPKDGGRNA